MNLSRRFDGKKFVWDGNAYSSQEQARQKAGEYRERGFQVEQVVEHESDEKYYLFTRREIKETVAEGKPQ